MFKVLNGVVQVVSTVCCLLLIYMIYAFVDMDEFDLITEIGFLVIQPLIGLVYIFLTILSCFLIGLPLRLIQKLNCWWQERQVIPVLGLAFGFVLILMSFNTLFTNTENVILDSGPIEKEIPNFRMSLIGWFMIAFSLLHFYPTNFFRKYLKNYFT